MADDDIREEIRRFIDEDQDPKAVAKVYDRVSGILTRGERITYIAVQDKPLIDLTPVCVVLTNRRFIVYQPQLLGRAEFTDYIWRDLEHVSLKEDVIGATLTLEPVEGETLSVEYIPKPQARRVYALAQEQEEEVREERRRRDLEERRAAAGGIMLGQVPPVTVASGGPVAAESAPAETADRLERLRELKEMLDAGLITQEEYDAKKQQILAEM